MEFIESRILIATYMKRLYNRGLTTSTGGNISQRVSDNLLLITPSQKDKSNLKAYDICLADFDGNNLTPKLKCSMELLMHIEIYKIRPDIISICHAHPIFASSFSYCDEKIESTYSGEMRALCGDILVSDYSYMGSSKLATLTSEIAEKTNAIILKNHGAISLGKSLNESFERMEILEKTAQSNFILRSMKNKNSIPREDIEKIDELFGNRFG